MVLRLFSKAFDIIAAVRLFFRRRAGTSFFVRTQAAPLLTVSALLLLSGCASMDWGDYSQTVLVRSQPAGARVYEDGQFLGITPAFVRVRRSHAAELEFKYPNQPEQKVSLTTKYRWADSFAANLMFLIYAPAGWLIDWATGTAWRYQDPAPANFPGASPLPQSKREWIRIAVAPPVSSDLEVADAIGSQIVPRLRARSPKYKVLDYETSSPLFQTFGSEQGLTTDPEARNNLFYQLKVDEVLTSEVTPSGDQFKVATKTIDVYSGQPIESSTWEMAPADKNLANELSLRRNFFDRFHFLPNTLLINASNYQPSVTIDQVPSTGKGVAGDGFVDRALQLISAVGFERLERPRYLQKGHWTFDFVPTLNFSKKNLEFPNTYRLQGATFERLYASAGYGFELGYQSRWGFPYFDMFLAETYTKLKYSSPGGAAGDLEGFNIGSVVELGYSYFFSDHFVGKVFVRGVGENEKLWSEALSDITGLDSTGLSVDSSYSGIAIGYYFPSSLSSRARWKVRAR